MPKKILIALILCLGLCLSFIEAKEQVLKHKYHPQTREELQALVDDLSVNLGGIDTSKITDMSKLFYFSPRENFSGIETWDTSKVTNMQGMFSGAEFFNYNINSWNVSEVRDMSGMFYRAESFNQPLNSWNVRKVENMEAMFAYAHSFNQSLDSWDTSKVINMADIFHNSPLKQNPPKWYKE